MPKETAPTLKAAVRPCCGAYVIERPDAADAHSANILSSASSDVQIECSNGHTFDFSASTSGCHGDAIKRLIRRDARTFTFPLYNGQLHVWACQTSMKLKIKKNGSPKNSMRSTTTTTTTSTSARCFPYFGGDSTTRINLKNFKRKRYGETARSCSASLMSQTSETQKKKDVK